MSQPIPLAHAESSGPPVFERVAIVGTGLIGASLALAIRRRWPSSLVIGVDRNEVIERAMVAHVIDVGADDLGMISEADLIVLAAPIKTNERILTDEIARLVRRTVVITDVGSTKRGMMHAARSLPPRFAFVGGHPIAGRAEGGLQHARPDLFEGHPWILCPPADADATRLRELVTAIGAHPVEMSPERHDHLMAFVSHLPQLAASALMHAVGEAIGAEGLALAGRGLGDTTRLSSSPPDIWRDVASANADELTAALDAFIEVLRTLRGDLEQGNDLERVFRSARDWKSQLERR